MDRELFRHMMVEWIREARLRLFRACCRSSSDP
jgi:hypothetical protein